MNQKLWTNTLNRPFSGISRERLSPHRLGTNRFSLIQILCLIHLLLGSIWAQSEPARDSAQAPIDTLRQQITPEKPSEAPSDSLKTKISTDSAKIPVPVQLPETPPTPQPESAAQPSTAPQPKPQPNPAANPEPTQANTPVPEPTPAANPAPAVDSEPLPLSMFPLPEQSKPLESILPQGGIQDPQSGPIPLDPGRVKTDLKVNTQTREVLLQRLYINRTNNDTTRIWNQSYGEMGDYAYDMNQMALKKLWLDGIVGQETAPVPEGDSVFNIDIPIKLPAWMKDMKLDKPKLELDGTLIVSVGGVGNTTNKETVSNASLWPGFNPNFESSFKVKGTIGCHITINLDNQEGFGIRNRLKITYKECYEGEFEDFILQEIEAGNTSLSLPGTELTGYAEEHQGLFGIKAKFKFGDLWLTTIASQEGGSQEEYTMNTAAREQDFVIREKEFVAYKHYFINEAYREKLISNLLRGNFTALGQPPTLEVWTEAAPGQSEGVAEGVTGYLPNGQTHASDLRLRKLEANKEYTWNRRGYLTLKSGRRDALIAVVYSDAPNGLNTKVIPGRIRPNTGQQSGGVIIIKDKANVETSISKLMVRNHYRVGYSADNKASFQLTMADRNNTQGDYMKTLGLIDSSGVVLRENPNIFDTESGEMILPCREKSDYTGAVTDATMRQNCLEPLRNLDPTLSVLYTERVRNFNRIESKYHFKGKTKRKNTTLRVSDSRSVNSGGCVDIAPGSEKLKTNSYTLKRGVDYEVLYELGQIELLSDRAKDPNQEIKVTYECEPLFQIENKFLLGARAEYYFNNLDSGSLVGATALYKNQTTDQERPQFGNEPFSSLLLGANIRLTDRARWMDKFINSVPLIHSETKSRWLADAEIARSYHNPNTSGDALLEDFEGSKRELPFSMRRNSWTASSPPGGTATNDLLTYDPLLDYRHKGEFIWHSNNETRFRYIYGAAEDPSISNQFVRLFKMTLKPNDNLQGNSWGGIMRANSDYYRDMSQHEYIELVVQGNQGSLYLDFGQISEDIPINGNAPNLSLDTEGDPYTNLTRHDDGLDDATASGTESAVVWTCREEECNSVIRTGTSSSDPAQDDFDAQKNSSDPDVRINGTEGNESDKYSYDTEDLNRNGSLDGENSFVRYKIDLNDAVGFQPLVNGWRRYIIPLEEFHEVISNSNDDFQTIIQNVPYTRIWMGSLPENVEIAKVQIAKFSVVGNQWEASTRSTDYEFNESQNQQITLIDGDTLYTDLSTPSSDPDSNFIDVRVVNNRDDINTYVASPRTRVETERNSDVPLREQSLMLRYGNLHPGQQVSVTRFFDADVKDLTSYETLKMEIHLDSIGNVPENVRFGIQFGQGGLDGSGDYYEWSFRPRSARNCPSTRLDDDNIYSSCHKKVWDFNAMSLDLVNWPQLKLQPNWTGSDIDTVHMVWDVENRSYQPVRGNINSILDSLHRIFEEIDSDTLNAGLNDQRAEMISIVGNPSLSRINWMRFVVYVDEGLPETDEIHGNFWINDMRLSGVRSGWGTAGRSSLQFDFADVMSLSGNLYYQDGNFATLSSGVGSPLPSLSEAKSSIRHQSDFNFNLDKFFPGAWKVKMPFSLSYQIQVDRPYLKPQSDLALSQDDFDQLGEELLRGELDIQADEDRTLEEVEEALREGDGFNGNPQSKGYQTWRDVRTLSWRYSKDYVKDANLFQNIGSQVLFERPTLNYRFSWSRSRSALSADSVRNYRTEIGYKLGHLEKSKSWFQYWPEKFDLTLIDFDFTRDLQQPRNIEEVEMTLDKIVDYNLDLTHSADVNWNIFPFLNLTYGTNIFRDMDDDHQDFSGDYLFDDSHNGFLAWNTLWAWDTTDYRYIATPTIETTFIEGNTLRDTTYNILSSRSTQLGREYGILHNERRRSQNFGLSFNPRWLDFLTLRTRFQTNFNHNRFLPDDFDAYEYGSLQNTYWTLQRDNTFEIRPTLKLNQLFKTKGKKTTGGLNEIIRKWRWNSITSSWSVNVKDLNEDYTFTHLDSTGIDPYNYYLYSLGLGDGHGFRNGWDIISGDMGLQHGADQEAEDFRGFAQYLSRDYDPTVYQLNFMHSVSRKAQLGTRATVPYGRVNTSANLFWQQDFTQYRETPLYLDTTLVWPKWNVGVGVPNFAHKFDWLKKYLTSFSTDHKFQYERQRISRPFQTAEDYTNRTYSWEPLIKISGVTKKRIRFSNAFNWKVQHGWNYPKANPELSGKTDANGDPIIFVPQEYYPRFDLLDIDWAPTPFTFAGLIRSRTLTRSNDFTLAYDMPTNKGFRLWGWYIRLKNPIRFKVNFTYEHQLEWRKEYRAPNYDPLIGDYDGDNINEATVIGYAYDVYGNQHEVYAADWYVNLEGQDNPDRTTPINKTTYLIRPSAEYRFTDKITADAFVEYQHRTTRYDASQSQETDQNELIEQKLQYNIQLKMIF